jgi:hypothetical protein
MEFELAGKQSSGPPPEGIHLGRYLGGDTTLPREGGTVVLPFDVVRGHLLVLGDWRSGVDETLLRIAQETAARTKAPVFYFNADHEPGQAERFGAAMEAAGRRARCFPEEPMDLWRGDWHQNFIRLQPLIEGVDSLGAGTALELACRSGAPPRSHEELLERLHDPSLFEGERGSEALRAAAEAISLRLRAVLGDTSELYAGDWAWEDVDAAYVTVPPHTPSRDRDLLNSYLLFSLEQHRGLRKESGDFCLVVIQNLKPSAKLRAMLGRAGSSDMALVVCAGGPAGAEEAADEGLLSYVSTVLIHQLPSNRAVAGITQWPLDLAQPPGTAWLVQRGEATQVEISG